MLGQRACRVMNTSSGNSRKQARSSSSPASTAKLTESEREARWKIVTIKLLWVLRNFMMKNCTQAVLGREAYQRIFHRIKSSAEASRGIVNRVINGEIVGKALPSNASLGAPVINLPEMCQHESRYMKTRGNRTTKWWTCISCQSRWERRPLDMTPTTGPPTDTEVLTFGKFVGMTFLQTATMNPNYCKWILQTAESEGDSSPQLQRLAQYLVARERTEADDLRRDLRPSRETDSEMSSDGMSSALSSDAELL